MTATVAAWIAAAQDRSNNIERAENAAEDAEMAGKNYAITLTPLSVNMALEASAADVPALVDALRAVLDMADDADADARAIEGDEMTVGYIPANHLRKVIATALGVES